MEQLQYTENEMRAFTDNVITKRGCVLRVRAGDWELGLLETYELLQLTYP